MSTPIAAGVLWLDRKGEEIKTYEEAEDRLSDPAYRIIQRTELDNGYWVSTVWTGLSYTERKIHKIFETKVFYDGTVSQVDAYATQTEVAAMTRHKLMVQKWEKKPTAKRPKDAVLIEGTPGYGRAPLKRKKGKNANRKA